MYKNTNLRYSVDKWKNKLLNEIGNLLHLGGLYCEKMDGLLSVFEIIGRIWMSARCISYDGTRSSFSVFKD